MPLKFISVCYLCLVVTTCLAQPQVIDSLRSALINQTREDTFRLNTLISLARASSPSDYAGGMAAAESAIVLAKKLKLDAKLGQAYQNKGILYHGQGDYENFISQLDLALLSYQEAKDLNGQARVYWAKGVALALLGKYEEAIEMTERSVKLYKQTSEDIKMANSLNSMGAHYFQLTNYPKAMQYYLEALAIYEQQKDNAGQAMANSNVGLINKYLTRYSKAIEHYEKAITVFNHLGDRQSEAKNLNMIGAVYDDSGNVRKALEYYHRSFAINKKENYKWGIAADYSNMGIAYIDMNEYDSALFYLQTALPLIREINDIKNEGSILTYLGIAISNSPDDILVKYKISPSSKLTIAEEYLKKGLAIKTDIENLQGQMVCWEGLAGVYKKQQNYAAATNALEKVIVLKDSMFSDEKSIAIARSEMQFDQDRKDAVLKAEHAAEIRQQKSTRNFLAGGVGLIAVASGLLFLSYKKRRDAISKKNDAELKAQITDTEMKVMRLQMNPHFIFNSLNSISDYITKNNPKEADEYLSKFAKVMRMTLENSEQQAIPLSDDLKALDLYMQLEAKRLSNKFTYEIKVGNDIDKENTLVPPMIFQPFVENSIWHGIAMKEGQGHIIIDITKDGEMLHCRIDDDGIGRNQAETMKVQPDEKKQSLGMRITRARIEILNKLKGSNATVQLVDKPQGVRAELKLPLETNF